MNAWLIYLLGVATPFAAGLLWTELAAGANGETEISCATCGRTVRASGRGHRWRVRLMEWWVLDVLDHRHRKVADR